MQLSRKKKNFFSIFFQHFGNLVEILDIFEKTVTLIAEVFPKLRAPTNMVKSISKRSGFWGSFGKQHRKRAKILLKFEWQHIYHIY